MSYYDEENNGFKNSAQLADEARQAKVQKINDAIKDLNDYCRFTGVGAVRRGEYNEGHYVFLVKQKVGDILKLIYESQLSQDFSDEAYATSLGICASCLDQERYLEMLQGFNISSEDYGYENLIEQVKKAYTRATQYVKDFWDRKSPTGEKPVFMSEDENDDLYKTAIGAIFFRMHYPSTGIMVPRLTTMAAYEAVPSEKLAEMMKKQYENDGRIWTDGSLDKALEGTESIEYTSSKEIVEFGLLYPDFSDIPDRRKPLNEMTRMDKLLGRPQAELKKILQGYELDPRVSLADKSLFDEEGVTAGHTTPDSTYELYNGKNIGDFVLGYVDADNILELTSANVILTPGLNYIGKPGINAAPRKGRH